MYLDLDRPDAPIVFRDGAEVVALLMAYEQPTPLAKMEDFWQSEFDQLSSLCSKIAGIIRDGSLNPRQLLRQ